VSYTTRKPRTGENRGVDYHFVSKAKFLEMIEEGRLYEYTQYGEDHYGSGIKEFYKNDVFIKETDGIKKLNKEDRQSSFIIYLNTPKEIRVIRMIERGWDQEQIDKRLKEDNEKFKDFKDFDIEITYFT